MRSDEESAMEGGGDPRKIASSSMENWVRRKRWTMIYKVFCNGFLVHNVAK